MGIEWPTITALLTNKAFGNYGGRERGTTRRVTPKALLCIHITGNENVPSAMDERNYANRVGSNGPSAHDYIDRDGKVVHAIDERYYAAWSNGDVNAPNTTLDLVKMIQRENAAGYNANEMFVREVECVGYPGTFPITAAQLDTVARMVAYDSLRTGIVISRATVGTHADLNSVTRSRCAFSPTNREEKLAQIITLAKAYLAAATPKYTQAEYDAAKRTAYNDGVRAASVAALTAQK